jgi:hypothetical protein
MAYHEAVKKGQNVPLGLFLGRRHSGRLCLALPCFSYKYRGDHKTAGGRNEGRKREKENKKERGTDRKIRT